MNFTKLPPQATDLEKALLGVILLGIDVEEVIEHIPSEEVFYLTNHQIIYKAIIELFNEGQKADIVTICNRLKKNGQLEAVGGHYEVSKLTEEVSFNSPIDEYCKIIVEKYLQREIIRFAGEQINKAYEPTSDCFEQITEINRFGMAITDKTIRKNYLQMSPIVAEVMEETQRMINSDNKFNGVPSGYRHLDRITSGWQRGDLIILAARPSVGKTAFLLNLALGASTDEANPVPVGIFSLEMPARQLGKRIMANVADITLEDLSRGNMCQSDIDRLTDTAQKVARLPIYIDDTAGMTLTEFKAKALKMKRTHNVGIIFVDYLQIMGTTDLKAGSREQEVSKISMGLKQVAKTLDIPIVVLSQFSREVEKSGRPPRLSDLRDSGSIEQDADMVIFLYRHMEETLKNFPNLWNERNIQIAKHRNGKLADLIAKFEGDYQRFTHLDIRAEDATYSVVGDNKYAPQPMNQIIEAEEAKFNRGMSTAQGALEMPF